MMFTVKFNIEVALEKRRRNGVDGLDFTCQGTMPFVPHPGMMLAAFSGDDFREVENVYWEAVTPTYLQVFFKFDEVNSPKVMRQLGWKEES